MKHNKLLYLALILLCSGCVDAQKWTDDYDINFPAPSIETIDRTKVETGDTLHLTGSFEKLTTATIGDGYMKIISLSDDNKTVALLVAEACVSGKLVLQNAYQQKYTYSTNITVVNKGTVEIPEEIPVIFDTDMCFDVDDVGALAVLHTYADRKAAEILAVCFNETHKDGAAAIDAINTWYGRGDIPIGIFKGMLENPDKSNYLSYLAAYPHDVPQDNNSIKSAVDVYVETLSAQPDHSVVIISVGFLNNLELLLAAHKDLVARKVKKMVIMGGLIKDDFNFVRHNLVSITENVLKEWPTPIVITQLGGDVYTGACLEAQPDSPVREAYYRWFGNKFEGRSSWDAFAVLYAIKGKDFFVEKWDSDIVLQNGVSINMEEGRLHYITPLFTPEEYRRVIDDLICEKDR